MKKISFALAPYRDSDLPAMPEGQRKLMTNRFIRLKKLLEFVAEKLKLEPIPQGKIEDWLEFCIGEVVLPPKMYLSTVKARYANGVDLVMFYRPRIRDLNMAGEAAR